MREEERLEKITKPLVEWYQKEKRMLPWRRDKNPYMIWISEIMLQQTRIEAVKIYYERFIKALPTVQDLAQIEEEDLLKLWEGLGYYSRARNLKKAAMKVQEEYDGKMPKTYAELRKLPGIGDYTAGAIASIAYQEKVPAVDGNVLRVISRIKASHKDILLAETKKEVTEQLKTIMPKEAGDFNEGLMELGERVCIPNGEPLCSQCPIQEWCLAKEKGLTQTLPVRIKTTKRKEEKRMVFILQHGEEIAIHKREAKGLLANLYEFPNVLEEKKQLEQIMSDWGLQIEQVEELGEAKHIFSHIEWHMKGYAIQVKQKNEAFLWVNKEELFAKYAIPEAFRYYKKKIQ